MVMPVISYESGTANTSLDTGGKILDGFCQKIAACISKSLVGLPARIIDELKPCSKQNPEVAKFFAVLMSFSPLLDYHEALTMNNCA